MFTGGLWKSKMFIYDLDLDADQPAWPRWYKRERQGRERRGVRLCVPMNGQARCSEKLIEGQSGLGRGKRPVLSTSSTAGIWRQAVQNRVVHGVRNA